MSFWMLDDFRAIDVQRGLYTCENYETFTKQEIGHIFSEAYASNLFKLGEELQKLSLTSDAVNTLRAFVIFNPGEPVLCNGYILPKCVNKRTDTKMTIFASLPTLYSHIFAVFFCFCTIAY